MSIRVFEDEGAAELNKAVQVGRVESVGPLVVVMENLGTANCVLSFSNEQTSAQVLSDKDTAVANEDTVYDGNTSTLVFSGESLDNTPIIPKSVTVKPTAGGDSVNCTDRDGDGRLYTDDVDEDFCGTIDYFSGALELGYPVGKAPNTTNILADYSYQDEALGARSQRNFTITNSPPEQNLLVFAACDDAGGSRVRTNSAGTWL